MFADPTFWVATGFVAFFGLLIYKKVPGMIGAKLDERADKIRSDIEEAEKLREEAQALLADYQRKQRDAVKEAEAIVEAAKEEAARMAKQGQAKLKDSIKRREKQAMDRIAQAEAAAKIEIGRRTADIAIAATESVLAGSIKGAKATAMIDSAIEDLGKKLN